MRVSELIEYLQDFYDEDGDADPEVRIGIQPSYPLEATIGQVDDFETLEGETVVYLLEGRQIGYLPGEVFGH